MLQSWRCPDSNIEIKMLSLREVNALVVSHSSVPTLEHPLIILRCQRLSCFYGRGLFCLRNICGHIRGKLSHPESESMATGGPSPSVWRGLFSKQKAHMTGLVTFQLFKLSTFWPGQQEYLLAANGQNKCYKWRRGHCLLAMEGPLRTLQCLHQGFRTWDRRLGASMNLNGKGASIFAYTHIYLKLSIFFQHECRE